MNIVPTIEDYVIKEMENLREFKDKLADLEEKHGTEGLDVKIVSEAYKRNIEKSEILLEEHKETIRELQLKKILD